MWIKCSNYNGKVGVQRADFAAVSGVLALLAVAVLPLLANTSLRAERLACINNLRLIAQAFQQWSLQHDDLMPWSVLPVDGGVRGLNERHELWALYAPLSNDLSSPKVLTDPADSRKGLKIATTWDNSPVGGLKNSTFRNNAISYFVGLHADWSTPRSMIAGDRNLSAAQSITNCTADVRCWSLPIQSGWTNSIHWDPGNISFMDGSVEEMDSNALRRARSGPIWNDHFVFPF